MAARPYAQMLTNVLKSLVARAEIYDPETGEPKHPLLAQRPEKNILADRGHRRQGLAGAFNANITEDAASVSRNRKPDKNIDIECHRPQGPRLHAPPLSDGAAGADAMKQLPMERRASRPSSPMPRPSEPDECRSWANTSVFSASSSLILRTRWRKSGRRYARRD
jgi:hypothetical protein